MSQQIIDRAIEWVNEHYPELSDAEYDIKLREVCEGLSALDADADREP